MNTPSPEQIAKLPKWAQQHIDYLERSLHSCVTNGRILAEQRGRTDTALDYGTTIGPDRLYHLPNGQRVEFGIEYHTAPNGYESAQGIQVRWDPDRQALAIHGTGPLLVRPYATNHFHVLKETR